jgi:hypothetical protein
MNTVEMDIRTTALYETTVMWWYAELKQNFTTMYPKFVSQYGSLSLTIPAYGTTLSDIIVPKDHNVYLLEAIACCIMPDHIQWEVYDTVGFGPSVVITQIFAESNEC